MKREQPDRGMLLAIDAAGGQSALGRLIGRRQSTIFGRLRSGKPLWAESVLVVEAAIGIPRYDLRPDLFARPASTVIPVDRTEPRVSCDRRPILQQATA